MGKWDWTYDELILAVEYYLDHGCKQGPRADLQELSQVLRSLPIFVPMRPLPFRGPGSVRFKLGNLRSADPNQPPSKTNGSKLDGEVLAAFRSAPGEFRRLAAQIRATADDDHAADPVHDVDGSESPAEEGGPLASRHYRRERNQQKVRDKKRQVLATSGQLECEVCGFDFAATYGSRGYEFIECHHRKGLADSGATQTYLVDLALVCSNCHRMIHRRRPWLSVEEARALLE